MKSVFERLQREQPQLFSAADIVLPPAQLAAMAELIAAIERVFALPAYRAQVLAQAPEIARLPCAPRGVFYGYDFHLGADGPRLIEINTNAGGGLLNAYLLAAHGRDAAATAAKQAIVDMFREEWRLARGEAPLRRIAIVDEAPAGQFLAPEFALFVELFAEHGIVAQIADPADLQRVETADGERLLLAGETVDLVYKRLTDFYLETPACAALRSVFAAGGVVVTPHPQAHALYADKRNLMLLSDPQALAALGVDAATVDCLQRGVPRTDHGRPGKWRKILERKEALVLQTARRFRQPRRLSRRQADQAGVRGNPGRRLHRAGNCAAFGASGHGRRRNGGDEGRLPLLRLWRPNPAGPPPACIRARPPISAPPAAVLRRSLPGERVECWP